MTPFALTLCAMMLGTAPDVQPDASDSLSIDSGQTSAAAAATDSVAAEPVIYQRGKATYYGRKWHGRRTSSGKRLNINGYQCAHRTLPFGTKVKVTNTTNGRSCIVEVVDRGPHSRGLVIDLTDKAASDIGLLRQGIAPVTLEIVGE